LDDCSIYRIYNTLTNKSYIGKTTKTFEERYHRGDFIISTTSQSLKNDYKLFGKKYFTNEIIEKVPPSHMDSREVIYINLYNFLFNSYNSQLNHKQFNKLNDYKTVYYNISDLNLYFNFFDTDGNYNIRKTEEIIYDNDLSIYKCYNGKYIYLVPYKLYNKYSFRFKKALPLTTYFNIFGTTETIKENLLNENDRNENQNDKLLLNIINKEYENIDEYRYKHIYNNDYSNLKK